jgi:hypothetical protein
MKENENNFQRWLKKESGVLFRSQEFSRCFRKSPQHTMSKVAQDFPGYQGEVNSQGTPHGFGEICFNNGNRYRGQWQSGKRTGHGKYFYSNGSFYEGQVYDGHLHGKGVLTFANGNHYDGKSNVNLQNQLKIMKQVNLNWGNEKVMVYLLGTTENATKEDLKMIKEMALEFIIMQTKMCIKEGLLTA